MGVAASRRGILSGGEILRGWGEGWLCGGGGGLCGAERKPLMEGRQENMLGAIRARWDNRLDLQRVLRPSSVRLLGASECRNWTHPPHLRERGVKRISPTLDGI